MSITEYAYINGKFYRPNDDALAAGASISKLLEAGLSLEYLATRLMVPCEPPLQFELPKGTVLHSMPTPDSYVFANAQNYSGLRFTPIFNSDNITEVGCTDTMCDKFHPAFDMPSTATEALEKLAAWGTPLCMTFDFAHAKRMHELLAELVADRSQPPSVTMRTEVDVSTVEEAIGQVLDVSQTTASLIQQIAARDAHGKAKYGTSLDRTDLTLPAWLQHQSEELMDGAGYALAAKREAENLLRIKAAATEVCNAAQTASSLNELYAAIARLRDTL